MVFYRSRQYYNFTFRHLRFYQAGSRQAIAPRHANIHQDDVGFEFARQGNRLLPVDSDTADFDVVGFEQILQPFQHQPVIVD